MWLRIALALFLSGVGTSASAQTPKAIPARELDVIALDVFKEMHNRGAELYNAGDPTGCLKVYATALLTAKPFLKHRPAMQKAIEAGLAEAEKADGAKLQAFGLHKHLVKLRTDLEADLAGAEVPAPALPAQCAGVLTLNGKPVALASITLAGNARAFTATTDAEGRYAFADALPPGRYDVIVTGASVPAKYAQSDTSGIVFELAVEKNAGDLALQSK